MVRLLSSSCSSTSSPLLLSESVPLVENSKVAQVYSMYLLHVYYHTHVHLIY